MKIPLVFTTSLMFFAFVAATRFGPATSCHAGEPAQITLIDPKAATPEIFIDSHATPPEKFAAQELRAYLEKITGRPMSIRTDYWIQGRPAGKFIAVGKCRFTDDIDSSGLST